jgi:4-amino-4-deoxy-L-arabinose transferase-like glycosyltransferase
MLLFRSYEIPADADHWNFAYEAGRIARSLATGQGFSSPLLEPSGPSAFLPLGYPLVLAGIFRLFGVYTTQAAVVAYLLNCLFSALTCIALYRLGDRTFGRETGLMAAACLALYPPSIWHAVSTIWDTSLLGLCVVGLMAWLYGLPARPTISQLARTGLLMGLVALINPVPLLFYPVVALVLWKRLRDEGSRGYREIAVLTGSCLLVCVPWMVRNAVQMGAFTPRNGAGLNLRIGNTDKAWEAGVGGEDIDIYPAISNEEARLFHKLGETAYDRYCARLGIQYVRNHPGRFAQLTLMRIRAWWLGQNTDWPGNLKVAFRLAALKRFSYLLPLPFFVAGCIAAWRNRIRAGLLWALLAIYPIPYYITFVAERYHFPIEPFLLLVGSYGMIRISKWPGWRRRSSTSWNRSAAEL